MSVTVWYRDSDSVIVTVWQWQCDSDSVTCDSVMYSVVHNTQVIMIHKNN